MNIQSLKITTAAAMALCLVVLAAPAQAADQRLHNWMRASGVTARLIKLDRVDGFRYGLSITQPGEPNLLIAPGTQRRWLVQIDGSEAVLAPVAGSLQIIASDDDAWIWVCWLKQITTFLTNALACTTPLCFADNFLTMLINLKACTPTSSS